MLNNWSDYKSLNVLPFGGTDLMEQPAFILEAFKAIEDEKVSSELQRAEEELRKAKRRSR
tara:strand:- start:129 stop:308 length:180 start_codon:yes stop_codon:yes gene_type:complete